jgi:hypothetical protein
MKRAFFMLVLVAGLSGSCQKEEIFEQEVQELLIEEEETIPAVTEITSNDQTEDESIEDIIPEFEPAEGEEYFYGKIDSLSFQSIDTNKIVGSYRVHPSTGAVTLSIYSDFPNGGRWDEFIVMVICYYKGKGTYYTGNNYDDSWASYWNILDHVWYSDPGMGNPGIVEIRETAGSFVEGIFDIVAYDYEEKRNPVHLRGKFGVYLEQEP